MLVYVKFLAYLLIVFILSPSSHAGFFSSDNRDPGLLIYSVNMGNESSARSLIETDFALNNVNANGHTALIAAVKNGNLNIAKLLIKAGAYLNIKDNSGKTALHYAVLSNDATLVKLLKESKAKHYLKDKNGKTALDYAVDKKDIKLISLIDPKALKRVEVEAAVPFVVGSAVATSAGGGISTATVVTGAGVAAAGAGAAIAASGGGGSDGGSSPAPTPEPDEDNEPSPNPSPAPPSAPQAPPQPAPEGPSAFKTWEYIQQYGLGNSRASAAYERGYTGDGVVVAVVDTGVQLDHPDIAANIQAGGKNFFATLDNDPANDNLNDPSDDSDDGHGTHVAGIIAAVRDQNSNVPNMHGIAYNAKILPIKALSSKGGGRSNEIALGIKYAVEQNVDVINLSLGADTPFSDIRAEILGAINNGIVVSAAAGNSGGDNPIYPARHAKDADINNASKTGALIAVGAVDQSNNIASFSNRCGDTKDWCMVAPGVAITYHLAEHPWLTHMLQGQLLY